MSIFATGMHLFEEFGLTIEEVKDKFGHRVYSFENQKLEDPHEVVFVNTVSGLMEFSLKHKPELVFVHGDRIEAFAACALFAMRQVKVAHIEGGEISGTIDEIYRHCNTKLSTFHFVSSAQAAKRVRSMGEEARRIFCTGSPELDLHSSAERPSLSEVKRYYDIPFNEYGILIFHPVVSERADMKRQANNIVKQIVETGKNFVVIKPNNDPGFNDIITAYNDVSAENFRIIPSLRFQYFSVLLENARVVVGNSSLGVREAPFFGTPSVDIGTRQTNRARGNSITPLNVSELCKLSGIIKTEWDRIYECNLMFGDGSASKKIADIIEFGASMKLPEQKFYSD